MVLTLPWRYVDDTDMDKCTSDDEPDSPITFVYPAIAPTVENGESLLLIYDCETTGGSHLRDHIMEVGSMASVPDGVFISNAEFSSLCHTSLTETSRTSHNVTVHRSLRTNLHDGNVKMPESARVVI